MDDGASSIFDSLCFPLEVGYWHEHLLSRKRNNKSVKSKIRNSTMGDTKRQKTEMEKVEKIEKAEKEESGSVDSAELREDLLREAAKLVSHVPSTKIAIFVTPPSPESDVSMYSFGYPSVNGVVKTFLEDSCPVPVPVDADPEDAEDEEDEDEEDDEDDAEDVDGSSQGFWWEDAEQFESMNAEQLNAACDRMARLRDRMSLELDAKLRAQGSGNQQDLHNDKAKPKP
uniref:At3g12510-like protein n=1 Tax=Boechera stricta TaxID=72658 RepID=Q1L0Q5_BOEST|nr:At3g12510-like protein [Boechera stricta]